MRDLQPVPPAVALLVMLVERITMNSASRPAGPDGKQSNWVQTVPGKSLFTILRLYGPLQAWFDKTWRPGEIEPGRRSHP